jgi:hypothetical protein
MQEFQIHGQGLVSFGQLFQALVDCHSPSLS